MTLANLKATVSASLLVRLVTLHIVRLPEKLCGIELPDRRLHEDHETAMSAVRNLNGVEVGGRPLRIDLADSDPFLEGKTTVRGELVDMSETRAQWREREREREHERRSTFPEDPKAFLATVPQGVPLPPGTKAEDMITSMLASMAPAQVMDVLAQMKV